MDKAERAQVRLLLEHLGAERRENAALRNRAMHAEHSAKHILQSGATVRAALRIAEELATAFVTDAVAAVSDVAKDVEAFNTIHADVTIMFNDLQTGIDQAVKFATVGDTSSMRTGSVGNEANRLFHEVQVKTLRLLEIHRFSFVRTSPNDRKSLLPPRSLSSSVQAPKNKGGKPLAAHWDDMWASIAVSLWSGDLDPKTQADVKRAMLAWFDDQNIDISDTPVVERARALWLKIEAAR